MEETTELGKLLHRQQDQILTLQVLLQCLVDELVETKVIDENLMDDRLKTKIKSIQSQLDDMRKEQKPNINYFGGPMGEA